MYHKRKIIGSQQIQIIIFIIKNHYFIFRSIPNKQQGSESTSVLLEYQETYIHKVEFSALLKNRKCIKITANINNQQLEWNGEFEKASPYTRTFDSQKTFTIHGFSTKNNYHVLQCEYTIINRIILTTDRSSHQISIKSVLQNIIRQLLLCFNMNFNRSISLY